MVLKSETPQEARARLLALSEAEKAGAATASEGQAQPMQTYEPAPDSILPAHDAGIAAQEALVAERKAAALEDVGEDVHLVTSANQGPQRLGTRNGGIQGVRGPLQTSDASAPEPGKRGGRRKSAEASE